MKYAEDNRVIGATLRCWLCVKKMIKQKMPFFFLMNLACAEVTFISSLSFSTPALTSSQLFKHLVQSPMELRDSRCFLFFPNVV